MVDIGQRSIAPLPLIVFHIHLIGFSLTDMEKVDIIKPYRKGVVVLENNMGNVRLKLDDIKKCVGRVAYSCGIRKVLLFGSYFDGNPTVESDIDLLVACGDGCRGLKRISFMQDLEMSLGKSVDVLNIEFLPKFIQQSDLSDERRVIYIGQDQ